MVPGLLGTKATKNQELRMTLMDADHVQTGGRDERTFAGAKGDDLCTRLDSLNSFTKPQEGKQFGRPDSRQGAKPQTARNDELGVAERDYRTKFRARRHSADLWRWRGSLDDCWGFFKDPRCDERAGAELWNRRSGECRAGLEPTDE
jgi:hypothetical protein